MQSVDGEDDQNGEIRNQHRPVKPRQVMNARERGIEKGVNRLFQPAGERSSEKLGMEPVHTIALQNSGIIIRYALPLLIIGCVPVFRINLNRQRALAMVGRASQLNGVNRPVHVQVYGLAELAQHHMDLPAMVRRVVEHVLQDEGQRVFEILSGAVVIANRSGTKLSVSPARRASIRASLITRASLERRKIIVKYRGQRRRRGYLLRCEAIHPDLVAKADVVQGAVDAPERAGTFLPVLLVRQLGADLVQSLIGDAVVPAEHVEMGMRAAGIHPLYSCLKYSKVLPLDNREFFPVIGVSKVI